MNPEHIPGTIPKFQNGNTHFAMEINGNTHWMVNQSFTGHYVHTLHLGANYLNQSNYWHVLGGERTYLEDTGRTCT